MTQNTEQLIQETMASYYEYVVKVEGGCTNIAQSFKEKDFNTGLQGIVDLSGGLVWLLEVEERLQEHSYKINSPVGQVAPLFEKMNNAIEASNFDEVIHLLEVELRPLFSNAKDWRFEEVVS